MARFVLCRVCVESEVGWRKYSESKWGWILGIISTLLSNKHTENILLRSVMLLSLYIESRHQMISIIHTLRSYIFYIHAMNHMYVIIQTDTIIVLYTIPSIDRDSFTCNREVTQIFNKNFDTPSPRGVVCLARWRGFHSFLIYPESSRSWHFL